MTAIMIPVFSDAGDRVILIFLFTDVTQHDVFKLMVCECPSHHKDG